MNNNNLHHQLKILILSTRPPHYSGNLGGDLSEALRRGGHKVDYFTCPTYLNSTDGIYGESEYKNRNKIKSYLKKNHVYKNIINELKNIYFKIFPSHIKGVSSNGFHIHYPFENQPEYPVRKILNNIDKDYDLIITLYWHHFINSTSLKTIYNQIKCPIIILPVDMGPMTGGCYYFNKCSNYMKECIDCPGEGILKKGQCHKNYLIKKNNYNSINCAWVANSWVNQFAQKSKLFDNNLIETGGFILDESIYKPNYNDENRRSFGIKPKDIVLLARSSSEPRKGAKYIINAIEKLYFNITPEEKNRILIITIGEDYIYNILKSQGINVKNFGYVDNANLIKLYQISDFFLSASIDDAGPSMVNHSISCGTPVVCFNNGCAVDVVENYVSGFKTDEISENAYYDVLKRAFNYRLTEKYNDLRKTTRQKSLQFSSFESTERNIVRVYNKLLKRQHDVKSFFSFSLKT